MTQVLVIGAGLAGLTAASMLQSEGLKVTVLEKGRGVGGRLASRRIGNATFDHGAQFLTVRDSGFGRYVKDWLERGVVTEWFHSTGNQSAAHSRWRGNPSMTAIAKDLARELKVRLTSRVVSLEVCNTGAEEKQRCWIARTASGDIFFADAVLLTAPVPQSLALIAEGKTAIPPDILDALGEITYERCIAVMAIMDGPGGLIKNGGFAAPTGSIAWIADNHVKGVSAVPAVTIHGNAAFSEEHWEDDRREVGRNLIEAAQEWIVSNVLDFQVHGWRYSRPVCLSSNRFIATWVKHLTVPGGTVTYSGTEIAGDRGVPLVFAGDAFGGPRLEGAFLSGRAAADFLIKELKH